MGEDVDYNFEIEFNSERAAKSFCKEKEVVNFFEVRNGDIAIDGHSVFGEILSGRRGGGYSCIEIVREGLETVLEKYREKIRDFYLTVTYLEQTPTEEINLEEITLDEINNQ